jgi:hypothetical protein
MLRDSGVLQQRILGIVLVGKVFFFRNQVVDTVVTQAAQVQSTRLHFLLAVACNEYVDGWIRAMTGATNRVGLRDHRNNCKQRIAMITSVKEFFAASLAVHSLPYQIGRRRRRARRQ